MYNTPYQFMKAVILDVPWTFAWLGVAFLLLVIQRKRLKEKSTDNTVSQNTLIFLIFILLIQIASVSTNLGQDEVLRAEGTIAETNKYIFEVGNVKRGGIVLDSLNTPLQNKSNIDFKKGLKYKVVYTSKTKRILEAELKED